MRSLATVFKTLIVAVLAGTILTGCIKDKFDEPPVKEEELPDVEANFTIKQLKDLYTGTALVIEQDYIIEGIVISDDKTGNFYQTLVIQDAEAGVSIRIARSDLFTDFPVGRKVYVKLKGLSLGAYRNLIQVGASIDEEGGVGLIPAAMVDQYVLKGPRDQQVTSKTLTIAEISSEYQNMLITIKDVQFKSADAGQPYADAEKKQTLNRTIEDCTGKSVILRTSGYASFASEKTPSEKGEIVAIYQVFGTTNQLYIRDPKDISFTAERCGGTTEPVDTSAPSQPGAGAVALFPGYNFETFSDFTNSLSQALQTYATQAAGQGLNGSAALAIAGKPAANDFVFTIKSDAAKFPEGAKKLSFYVKGTAAKSLSLNLYKKGSGYYAFNVGDLSGNKLIKSATNNQYTGTINTNDKWVLVTLDLAGVADLNTDGSNSFMFALKVGSASDYNLYLDNFVIE